MKKSVFILLLLCFASTQITFGQQNQTRFELMVLECLTAQIPPSDWEFIMNVFEDYITTNGIREKNTSIEEGYMAYIRFRSEMNILPLIAERQEFKRRLYALNVLGRGNLIGYPLLSCLTKIGADYGSEIENTRLGELVSTANILSIIDISPTVINGGLALTLTADDFKDDLYRKIVILLSFLDIIYWSEIKTNEIEPNNPIARMLGLQPAVLPEDMQTIEIDGFIYFVDEYGRILLTPDDSSIIIINVVEDEVLDWNWGDDTRIEIIRIVEDDDIEIETIRIDVD